MSDRSARRRTHARRTCVGCRRVEWPGVLLRMVVAPGEDITATTGGVVTVVPDFRQRLMGRGAWLHPQSECYRLAERRRAIGRALRVRTGAKIDTEVVHAFLNRQDREDRKQVDTT